MLDSDLAIFYGCKNGTKEVNQAVRNNPRKFPERFSWVLENEEYNNLTVYYDDTFHDRYFVIDNNKVYQTAILLIILDIENPV